MLDEQTITDEEKVLLLKHLDKYEKGARQWKMSRYFVLSAVCLIVVSGVKSLLPIYRNLTTTLDRQVYIQQLQSEEIPEDVTADNWIVGYVNKSYVSSAYHREMKQLETFLACYSLLVLPAGILGVYFLKNRWHDGMRDLIIAKVLRKHLHEL